MPNRIVRDGLLDSRAVNSLSEAGEIFYRRLMQVVDDYGRHQADPDILRARCFPLKLDEWPTSRVADALSEVNHVLRDDNRPLVLIYSARGKQWLEITEFNQRLRSPASKCPAPDGEARADSGVPRPLLSTAPALHPNSEPGFDFEVAFDSLWNAYPAKGRVRRIESQQAFVDVVRNRESFEAIMAALAGKWTRSEKWVKGFIMALPSWLRQECWNEEPPSVEGESGPQYTRAE